MFFKEKIYKYTRYLFSHGILPTVNRKDTIYLVSFPKSGNTWVSFLVANVISMHLKLDINVNFFNIRHFVPELTGIGTSKLQYFPFRNIIKTHSRFSSEYENIFLLVRNPYDVAVSYFHYLTDLGIYKKDLSAFIRDKRYGARAWNRHIKSWINNIRSDQHLYLFSYEDFHREPEINLAKLFDIMGFQIDSKIIKKAVEMSSFENMKKLEQTTMGCVLKKHKNYRFVRQGKVGYKDCLSREDVDYIYTITKDTAEILKRDMGINMLQD